jgi:predicted RNA-binding Zn-ribbon protein involved in translation (DUF1610 family)
MEKPKRQGRTVDLGCPKCGEVSSTEKWNRATQRYCGGDEAYYTPLAEGYGRGIVGYLCPECDKFSSGKTLKEFQDK